MRKLRLKKKKMVIRKMYTSEWGQCSDEAGWHGWRYKWTNNESWYNTHEFYVVSMDASLAAFSASVVDIKYICTINSI